MTLSNRYRGNGLVVIWTTVSGTTVITGDQTEFSVDRSAEMIDASAGNDTAKGFLAGLKDSKLGLKAFETAAAGSAAAAQMIEGTYGTLSWGPQGTATGKPKFAVGAFVSDNKSTFPFDNKCMIDTNFQGSSAFISDYGATF